MAKTYRKLLSFQSGEISPLYFGRSDTDIYQKGLAMAENVRIDQRGGAIGRYGVEHVGQVLGDNARLFSLQVSRQRYYTILVRELEIVILAPGASLIGNNLLTNGNFAASGANWTTSVNPVSSQVQFSIGQAELLPEQNDTELTVNGSFDLDGLGWTIRESHVQSSVSFANGQCTLVPRPAATEYAGIAQANTTSLVGQPHTLTVDADFSSGDLRVRVGTVEADGSYLDTVISANGSVVFTPAAATFWITFDCEFPEVAVVLNAVSVTEQNDKFAAIQQEATVTASITDNHIAVIGQSTNDRLSIDIGTTAGASDIATFETVGTETQVEFVPNNATYWVSVTARGQFTAGNTITFVGTADKAASTGLGLTMPAPWTESQLDELHEVTVASGQVLYFLHPNVPPQRLTYDHATDSFVALAPVSFLNPPTEWTGTNWPSTGAHFQGRLWLAGTPNERQTIWASKSGVLQDFDKGTSLDDESIEITLTNFGRIEWMLGTKNLLVGAENAEYIVESAGGVITPSDFNVVQQSSFGSNNMQAIQVGEKVFYLTPDGRKLRAMSYEWQEDNWLSQDLTFASEHITAGIGKHSAWAQHPDSVFLIVMKDGTLAVLTYERTAQTVGWTRASVPGMKIIDITTGLNNGINEIAVVGQRVAGTLDFETSSGAKQRLDSYVTVLDGAGTNIITGLDHLEGLIVRPIVDDAVDPLKTVVGGQITTDTVGTVLHAGTPYTSKIITLPPDVAQGQIRSFTKRWNKVWALMKDSKQPVINGVRPPDRTPSTPMGLVEPESSKHFKTVNLGWDDAGQITIEQDLPVGMEVLAIYGEMESQTP